MTRYDVAPAWYRTPGGRSVLVYIREGTNDHNTAFAALTEDEYGLAGLGLKGHAIDVGGHLGTVTLGLLVDNPTLRVSIVEPLAANVALIRRNLEVNGVLDRAAIYEAAIGYPPGGTLVIHHNFADTEIGAHHAFIGNPSLIMGIGPLGCNAGGPHDHTEARLVTIGELVQSDTSFLKIDCEGGEWDALRDPAVARVPLIKGEVHNTDGHRPRDVVPMLPDHEVTFDPRFADTGPCEFTAVLR